MSDSMAHSEPLVKRLYSIEELIELRRNSTGKSGVASKYYATNLATRYGWSLGAAGLVSPPPMFARIGVMRELNRDNVNSLVRFQRY
jgi:hypothetical protein